MKSKCKLGDIISQRREKYNGENLPICGVTRDGFIPPKQKDADLMCSTKMISFLTRQEWNSMPLFLMTYTKRRYAHLCMKYSM